MKQESLWNILKKNERIDLKKVIDKISEIPTGSSSLDTGCLHFSEKQIEEILRAVPSTFPYGWEPKNKTSEQARACGNLNDWKRFKGYPISSYDVAHIIQKAEAYKYF